METIAPSIAATRTTATFVPQAYKIIRSRETVGVSLLMHVAFAGGVAFWFALGVILWNWPMMIANALTFVLTIIIVTTVLRYYG
jgi:MtN3 and saliva related transmembrane protein